MNKVILMGRLVADPVLKFTQSNAPVCKFRLAVNKPGKQSQGQPTADFFIITAWRNTAEFVSKYFIKGQQILIEGVLRNNNYEDSNGTKHYTNDVHAIQVFFADSKHEKPEAQAPQSNHSDVVYASNEDDEDLPF